MSDRTRTIVAIALFAALIVTIVAGAATFLYAPATPAIPAVYTQQRLDYFRDIAFALPEYGEGNPLIYKWDDNLRINITGEPEYSDIDAVLSAIDDLKGLTGNISLALNDNDANVIVYVGKEGPILGYLKTNDTNLTHGGFFFWTRDDTFNVNRSVIAISRDYYSGTVEPIISATGSSTSWACTACRRSTRTVSSTRITLR